MVVKDKRGGSAVNHCLFFFFYIVCIIIEFWPLLSLCASSVPPLTLFFTPLCLFVSVT